MNFRQEFEMQYGRNHFDQSDDLQKRKEQSDEVPPRLEKHFGSVKGDFLTHLKNTYCVSNHSKPRLMYETKTKTKREDAF